MRDELDAAVPRPNPRCNFRSLPLSPVEGFVLSRVDGHSTLHEIGATTGLGPKVREVIARLVELGAVFRVAGLGPSRSSIPDAGSLFPPPASADRTSDAGPASIPAGASRPPAPGSPPPPAPGSIQAPQASVAPPATTSRPIDPARQALLDEPCDLDQEQRVKVLDLFEKLDSLTHYEILEIAPAATKKEVKSAYYKLAPSFHPDRFFRRDLGSFKARMEAIFARITEAQETLVSKDRRAAYDADLAAQGPRPAPPGATSGSRSAPIPGEAPDGPGFDELTFDDPLPRPPSIRPLGGESDGVAMFDIALPPGASSVPAVPPPPPPRVRTAEDDLRRRQALMARLRGGPAPSAGAGLTTDAPPESAAAVAADLRAELAQNAADSLKRRFAEAREATDRGQIARFVEVAQIAAGRNDPVSAANAYRLAARLAPEDTGLQELVREWGLKAAVSMADSYFKQGEADERSGRAAEAADSYMRATIGMPRSALAHERAAAMLLLANGDARRAVELARKAVELAPNHLPYRVTLAESYVNAKLFVTAKAEIDSILAQVPTNDRAKVLLKKLPR